MSRFRLNAANISATRCLLLVIHHYLIKRNHWLPSEIVACQEIILRCICILSVFQEAKNH
jgi:hypothetical protein